MGEFQTFRHGSAWVKADFHLHTKADKQFIYKGEENSFLQDYIDALKKANVQIGLIANHNKFDREEFSNLKKKAKKEEILLLPGVELSVNDGANGIHTLIVFSEKWLEDGKDFINPFLNVVFQGKVPEDYEREDGRCSKSLLETIKTLDIYNKDYFIIFAHVEQNSGLWCELDGGRLKELGKDPLFRKRTLGFQKVRTHDQADKISRKKIQSFLNDWYPAEVEGSDCKNIEKIGNCGTQKDENGIDQPKETYLKIGDFSFDAVKYALIDHHNRVRYSLPERLKHSYIKSISFQGGVLDGKEIYFSPELNTLIGIRGSGKSSILESLRYVLDIPFGDKALDDKYKNGLVSHTFGSGGIAEICAVDQYGSEYRIRRTLNHSSEVFVDGKLQPGVSIRETIIKKPIYFGQKDLSSSGEGFEKELVEKLLGDSLYEIRQQIEDKKLVLVEAVQRFKKYAKLDEQIEDYTQKKQDAEYNAKKFKDHGIEEKLKKQTDFDADERKLKSIQKDIKSFQEALTELLDNHEDDLKNHNGYQSEINQAFFLDVFIEYSKLLGIYDEIRKSVLKIDEIYKKLDQKQIKLSDEKRLFLDEFAEIRRKIEGEIKSKGIPPLNIEEYPTLKAKIDTSSSMLEVLRKEKQQIQEIQTDIKKQISELNELWNKEFHIIKKQLEKVNSKNTSLNIDVEYKGDKQGFLNFAKSSFKGSGIRETTLIKLIAKEQTNYQDFGEMYLEFDKTKKIVDTSSEKFEETFLENLATYLTYKVENKFTIYYKGKELLHHSLGQRASALILFILNQHDNDLILIDQPEDDLDNQTIYEDVIKLIRELKPTTQFVFATHNANFPVLGDAELVLSCKYEDDKILIQSGSIDSPLVQKEIVNIMEGGEDAFNKRKEIYSIWKP
ncbi:TrlF family AAA-like ATPase [Leptospira levettii]|uniref:TrlF family AAA-like ATPase n=1 Tax=Leptospira levettii TaxID=2023178 RepID=UPI0010828323|nr:AAA family ATPase [Leptospira levettii]TGL13465.1 histidinol-phosphatase [Leptospira levettii]